MEFVVFIRRLVFDLNLVAAAQVHAAISFLRAVVLNVQFEIFELARGLEVCAVFFIDEFAVFHYPVVGRAGVERFPAGQVLPIEHRDDDGVWAARRRRR